MLHTLVPSFITYCATVVLDLDEVPCTGAQVDKIGKNLNPSGDPLSGLHTFDEPAAGLPTGY